jgi:hypothetical protein
MKNKIVSFANERVAPWQILRSLALRMIRKKSFASLTIKPKSDSEILGRIKNMRARRVRVGGLRAAFSDFRVACCSRLRATRLAPGSSRSERGWWPGRLRLRLARLCADLLC